MMSVSYSFGLYSGEWYESQLWLINSKFFFFVKSFYASMVVSPDSSKEFLYFCKISARVFAFSWTVALNKILMFDYLKSQNRFRNCFVMDACNLCLQGL